MIMLNMFLNHIDICHNNSFLFRSYEEMENEVSQILGFRWYALNDKQYKLTPVNLNVPYYYEGFEEAE